MGGYPDLRNPLPLVTLSLVTQVHVFEQDGISVHDLVESRHVVHYISDQYKKLGWFSENLPIFLRLRMENPLQNPDRFFLEYC